MQKRSDLCRIFTTYWKFLVKIAACITSLLLIIVFFPQLKTNDPRLCANEHSRHLCSFPSPLKTERLPHAFGRLNQRIKDRLQQRCGNWNQSHSDNFLAHDFVSGKGLGNFMFMAASTLGLAISSGRTPIIDDPHDHLRIFQNPFPKRNSTRPSTDYVLVTGIPDAGIYDATLTSRISSDTSHSLLLKGYLQSWKYFIHERYNIRCQFTLAQHIYNSALEGLKSKLEQYPENVLDNARLIGIHVRRGDIINETNNIQRGHVPASDQYLLDSYAELNALYKSRTVFIVISNSLPYCQTLLGNRTNVVYMEGNSAAVDLAVLSLMDDVILTVGTYGWWGAFLSDAATVRYYKLWPRAGSIVAGEYNHEDYFLPHWVGAE